MSDTKEISKPKFILDFEEFIESKGETYWKKPEEIASMTGRTATEVVKLIDSYDEFIKNNEGQYTTVNLYKKHTPFFERFLNLYRGGFE